VIVYFVPKFAPIFERQAERGELPWATTALLQFSNLLRHYGIWVLAILVAGLWWACNKLRSEAGRYTADRIRLQMPGLGPIVRSLGTARFCRILGTMLKNGVPLLLSLRIAKDATGNRLLSDAIGRAADSVTAGKSLARPLAASGQFGEEIVEMIAVGEEANNLEDVLVNISENLERNTYRQLEMAVKLIEPIMLIVMALAILFVVVALLLPVFQGANALK